MHTPGASSRNLQSAILLVTLTGLLFTITNYVPVSVLPSALFLCVALLLPFARMPLPEITAWAMLYYAASLISIALYDPRALIQYEFYRWDGNFIISFAPSLMLPFLVTGTNPERPLFWLLLVSTMIDVPLALSQGLVTSVLGANGLFFANNAFGGFLMFICAFAFSRWRDRKLLSDFALFALNLAALVISQSRGSLLGLMCGILAFYLLERKKGYLLFFLVLSIVAAEAVILYFTYPIYLSAQNIFALIADNSDGTKEANVAMRALRLWPMGLDNFLHSPIFGAGFGSVNDLPHVFSNGFHLFQFNQTPIRRYDDGNAHNTYLEILGDQGVVGLLIFLGYWRAIYRFIRDHRDAPVVRNTLMIGFWALTFASFTEHRIPTPSNAVPFQLTLLLYFAYVRNWRAENLPNFARRSSTDAATAPIQR